MDISVIIQSRGDCISNIKNSIACYIKQIYSSKELIFVIDQKFTKQSYKQWLIDITDGDDELLKKYNIHIYSNLNSSFKHNNVSSMRNLGAQKANGEFINFMDDDEDIPSAYLMQEKKYWNEYRKKLGKDFVLTPTLMYRHTGEIQNQGFESFNYWLSRPTACVLGQREWAEIQMYSGNSLFAPAYIFQQNKMDERFDFVYEDLAYSYSLHKKGYTIIVSKNIELFHMEREKTKLEQAWIGNIYQAHRKAKHRILFVRTFANFWQKIQFFLLGFLGQPLWLTFKVIINRPSNMISIIKQIWKGTINGLLCSK